MNKKFTYLVALVAIFSFGCQKVVEETVQNAVGQYLYNQLKNGNWTVTKFTKGGKDSTAVFQNWKTYFNSDNSFSSIKRSGNATVDSAAGTWGNDATFQYFNCNYTYGLKWPLNNLNGQWRIDTKNTNLQDKVSFFRANASNSSLNDSISMQKN